MNEKEMKRCIEYLDIAMESIDEDSVEGEFVDEAHDILIEELLEVKQDSAR
jgi:hypothetical protein